LAIKGFLNVSTQAFIGKKIGMTQVFDEEGNAVPVTVVQLEQLTVTQVKTPAIDGYSAIQVGYQVAKEKHLNKPLIGHLEKHAGAGVRLRRLIEFRVPDASQYTVGQVLTFDDVASLGLVDVTGTSIGKGFQGVTKRYHHHRGPMSHGSKSHRLPGSIGAGTTPGRVFKGHHMAGNMGNERVTTRKLKVVKFLPEDRLLLIKGAVPGVEGGTLVIKAATLVGAA
jgi:large subunit ribosomal protein L3